MDNNQMPLVQPNVTPEQMAYQPVVQPVPQQPTSPAAVPIPQKKNVNLIKTVAIVVLSLIAVTFIGLFIWMFVRYDEASTDVEGQISIAVAEAKAEQAEKDEAEFAEREKDPYRTFTGPADYGQVTFKYPKTWSLYIAQDASRGGDFAAYFNPIEVNAVSDSTVNALRVIIKDKDFESVAQDYQRAMDQKDSNLSVESVTVAGTAANRYTGKIPGTDLNGYIVIFKVRDKTVILQTDSVLFAEDFNKLLETVGFNA